METYVLFAMSSISCIVSTYLFSSQWIDTAIMLLCCLLWSTQSKQCPVLLTSSVFAFFSYILCIFIASSISQAHFYNLLMKGSICICDVLGPSLFCHKLKWSLPRLHFELFMPRSGKWKLGLPFRPQSIPCYHVTCNIIIMVKMNN